MISIYHGMLQLMFYSVVKIVYTVCYHQTSGEKLTCCLNLFNVTVIQIHLLFYQTTFLPFTEVFQTLWQ